MPVFQPFPAYIEVKRQDNGLLRVKTNTHVIEDLEDTKLEFITYPYFGMPFSYELKCDEPELVKAIHTKMEAGTALFPFKDDDHPVLKQCFKNWVYSYSHNERFHSMRSLEGAAQGKTILFLGAGPSFHKDVNLVRKLQGKVIIIAGGSAIRQCQKWGIDPDFCLAFDPRPSEEEVVFSYLTDEFIARQKFIVNQGLYHPCFKRLKTAYVNSSSSLPDLCTFIEPREEIIPEGRMGVATMVPYIAHYMGASKLYLLGVDLAYASKESRYTDIENRTSLHEDDIEVEGFITRKAWLTEAADLERTAKNLDISIYNASQSSLLGLTDIEYRDIKTLRKTAVSERIKIDNISRDQTLEGIITELTQMKADLEEMLINRGYHTNDRLRKSNAFIGIVATYDMLQKFSQVRVGEYNHTLLRNVIKNNIRWIEQALAIHEE